MNEPARNDDVIIWASLADLSWGSCNRDELVVLPVSAFSADEHTQLEIAGADDPDMFIDIMSVALQRHRRRQLDSVEIGYQSTLHVYPSSGRYAIFEHTKDGEANLIATADSEAEAMMISVHLGAPGYIHATPKEETC